jgi:hypothetical protein
VVRAVLPGHPYARIYMPTTHPFHLFRAETRTMSSGTESLCFWSIYTYTVYQTKLTTYIYFLHRAYTLNGHPKWLLGAGVTLMYVLPSAIPHLYRLVGAPFMIANPRMLTRQPRHGLRRYSAHGNAR